MKGLATAATEGFVGSFVLAAAILTAIVGGAWRAMSRLFLAFVHHEPLPVGPGKQIKLP